MSYQGKISTLLETLNSVLRGKEAVVELAVACFLADGHLLIEDLPGTGKTTLAVALARLTDGEFRKVQFTSDLLPSDILGGEVYLPAEGTFRFSPGPIFTNVLLADEINRASPRTQSALLEAMAERRVSLSGKTYRLPEPFLVIATQNPLDMYGTYPLPESQLDRFLIRVTLGYPPREAEKAVLAADGFYETAREISPVISKEELLKMREGVRQVKVSDKLLEYLLNLGEASRGHRDFRYGFSTRGLLALKAASQALAFLRGRTFVTPDEVKEVFPAVAYHRLIPKAELDPEARLGFLEEFLRQVPVPL